MSVGRAPEAVPTTVCTPIELGRFDEVRGSLCVAEVGLHVGFDIKRAYWIFDVPGGHERADHAHREQSEVLVAARGSFTVDCDDGSGRERWRLDSPDIGLLVPPMVFHQLDDFAPGTLCIVLASGPYEHGEYVHDYDEFRELVSRR